MSSRIIKCVALATNVSLALFGEWQQQSRNGDRPLMPAQTPTSLNLPKGTTAMTVIAQERGKAHAAADLAEGTILASVEVAAPPDRAFHALISKEIVDWWVRPGIFDTTEWDGDLRVGGRWKSAGTGLGKPYELQGEFLEIDPPRKLTQTYHLVGTPYAPTIIKFVLEKIDIGTRITLRHSGFTSPELCEANRIGWETSFERLSEILATENPPANR